MLGRPGGCMRRSTRLTSLVLAGAALVAPGASAVAAPAAGPRLALHRYATFHHVVTGVTVAAQGRVFVSFPRWTEDVPVSVAEVGPGGKLTPYPDTRWNAWRNRLATKL